MRDEIDVPLNMDDFLISIKNIQKSVGKESLMEYAMWMKEFGSV